MAVLAIDTPRWAVPLLESSRYKGAHGGRGSGKSHERAEALIERCIMAKTDAVCIREVQKSIKLSVKRLIESKIESMGVGHLFDVKQDWIGTPFGGVIVFQGMQNHTAESIKSLEAFDIAWVEEAQSLSQRSLDLLRPTIRKPGSELWFTWNPNLPTDPVDVLLRGEEPPPGAIVVQANYRDNPWLPDVLADEMAYDHGRDPDKFAHIWLGEYQKNSEARVFKNWKIEEFETPSNAIKRLGADWGFSVDPTVLISCFIGRWEAGVAIPDERGRHLFIDYEAYEVGCQITKTPQLFDTVPDARAWPITADSARPETIAHMRSNGFPKIVPAIKGARSIEDGVEWIKTYDVIIHPRCVHAIDDFTLYSFETDPLTGSVTNKLADKSNNVIDAVRYACEGASRAARAAARETATKTVTIPKTVTAFNRNGGSRFAPRL